MAVNQHSLAIFYIILSALNENALFQTMWFYVFTELVLTDVNGFLAKRPVMTLIIATF